MKRVSGYLFLPSILFAGVLSANSLETAYSSGNLDIDGNGQYDALTDGLLVLRSTFEISGDSLIAGVLADDAAYTDADEIEARILSLGNKLDIDANGDVDALTDGLLVLRYLFEIRGEPLISGVLSPDADRTQASEIEAYLSQLATLNQLPSFTSSASFNVLENQIDVGIISATHPDNSVISFSLSGTDSSSLNVDANSGVLTFKSAPDYEAKSFYTATVTASDGTNLVTQDITVTVLDVNEAPVFTSDAAFSADENQTAIGTSTATDPDGDTLTFSVSGSDLSISSAGVLAFKSAPDFETKSSYNAVVTTSEGTNSVTQDITVTVLDVNEVPVFTSDAAFSADENQTAIGTSTATDPDGETLTFSVSGSDLSISSAGVLTFKSVPDFEAKSSYNATVLASDEANSTTQDITISIVNLNDNSPIFSSNSSFSVPESQTSIGVAIANDADGDVLSYSVSGSDASLINIDSSNGVLQFNSAADYQLKSSYSFIVTASDGTNSTAQNFTVSITSLSSAALINSEALKVSGSEYFNLPLSYTCDGVNGGVSPTLSWSGVSDMATHLGVTMHSVNTDGSFDYQFSIFNIPSSIKTLHEGDFSIGTAAEGDMSASEIISAGGIPFRAPCEPGAGVQRLYIFTLYEMYAALSLTRDATHQEAQIAMRSVMLGSSSLTTTRIRYDDISIANDLHVPENGRFTCEQKTAHFNQYSALHSSISCNETTNQLTVVSHIADGLKTKRSDQQLQVGISSWIGRLSLPSQSGSTMRLTPEFLSESSNNISCDGTGVLGFSVDGQVILPYYKQSRDSGTGDNCGPSDGENYAGRDTVVLGEVDQCYGHSPNGEGYHLHGAPICLMDIHDPSKPIAYMTDGIPLYYGEAGGTIEETLHAQTAKSVTDTNYGAGLYEHLSYFPSDTKTGSNPLNDCNAYDINSDGAESGYVYYSTKDAPYSIGCFMGKVLSTGTKAPAANTKLLSERTGWAGQDIGQALNVDVIANYYGSFNGKTYNITEVIPNSNVVPTYLMANTTAQVLWRILDTSDTSYDASTTCFEFRYRTEKSVTENDETETICTEKPIMDATLDFTPFGD